MHLIKPNVCYSWSLKILAIKRSIPFNFAVISQGRHFMVDGPKNFKLLADISFESGLQNIVLPNLLLFSCACYEIDLVDIQWSEVATSTTRNFSNGSPYTFAQIFNSLKIQNVSNFYFKKEPPKKRKFFMFLRGRYFVMGGPIDMNVDVFWETSVDFLKCVVLPLFPKYSQSYVKLNVKI